MRRVQRLLGATLLTLLLPPAVQAQPSPLRVCSTDVPVPPYIALAPLHPGWTEHLLLESARALGVEIVWQKAPALRCRQLLQSGAAEHMFLAPVEENLVILRFPMKEAVWIATAASPA